MTNRVKMIFETDAMITTNLANKQFVESTAEKYSLLLSEGILYVVIKKEEKKAITFEWIRSIAGDIARELSGRKIVDAKISAESLTEAYAPLENNAVITAFVEGWRLGAYQFVKYKSTVTAFETELQVIGQNTEQAVEIGTIRAEATAFSRDLMNELSSELNPSTFPTILEEHFANTSVQVTKYNKAQLEEMQMHGVLTVGKASKYDPAFVEMKYVGDASKPLVALVGKGVTFDTGGISLKNARDISDMRMDMGGAAAVAGALTILAKTKSPVNVVVLIPIVENIPDSTSVLPGEIIAYKNGLTVQVGNTDAEGRLILADGLIRAGELNADYIVDIATLTGAIVHALGTEIGGVFGDEELSAMIKEIGDDNGDFVWPMPLVEAYESSLSSDYADLKNISTLSGGGSITASLFLRRFVPENTRWLHVDMAGILEKSKASGYYAKSATGYGARLLADFTNFISK